MFSSVNFQSSGDSCVCRLGHHPCNCFQCLQHQVCPTKNFLADPSCSNLSTQTSSGIVDNNTEQVHAAVSTEKHTSNCRQIFPSPASSLVMVPNFWQSMAIAMQPIYVPYFMGPVFCSPSSTPYVADPDQFQLSSQTQGLNQKDDLKFTVHKEEQEIQKKSKVNDEISKNGIMKGVYQPVSLLESTSEETTFGSGVKKTQQLRDESNLTISNQSSTSQYKWSEDYYDDSSSNDKDEEYFKAHAMGVSSHQNEETVKTRKIKSPTVVSYKKFDESKAQELVKSALEQMKKNEVEECSKKESATTLTIEMMPQCMSERANGPKDYSEDIWGKIEYLIEKEQNESDIENCPVKYELNIQTDKTEEQDDKYQNTYTGPRRAKTLPQPQPISNSMPLPKVLHRNQDSTTKKRNTKTTKPRWQL